MANGQRPMTKKKPLDAFVDLARMSVRDRRRRSPVGIVVAFLVVVLPLAVLIYLIWPGPEQPPPLLAAFDQVAVPGETVSVCARVQSSPAAEAAASPVRCDLFFHELQSDWREKLTTGRDGSATIQRTVSGANAPVEITVRCLGEEQRLRHAQAKARIFTWPPESPLLLVDAEQAMTDVSSVNFWMVDNRDVRPRPGVVALLRAVQAKYHIGYLSTGADRPSRYNKLRAWLERGWAPTEEHFPDGPLLALGARLPLREPADFLQETLLELRRRFHGTVVGIAAEAGNARIFNDAGWRTFLLGESGEAPAGVTVVPSWNELSLHLP
jgi:hypothetical protein